MTDNGNDRPICKDKTLKDRLLAQLGVLSQAGLIELWSLDRVEVGAERAAALARAKVAVLLVSANFLSAEATLAQELPALRRRQEEAG